MTTDSDTDKTTDTESDTESEDSPDTSGVPRKYGDIEGDGKVTARDALLIQRYVLHLAQFDEPALKAADVNGDGKITNKDALEILRYILKLSKNEIIETPIE
ncbi:MAG: dockerin type I repeat-containing protein [Acutalibacteraceae bacterium]|nr:dockerin type I repeat-containing protein [Acutalibacteraceae bacterium]